MPFVCTLQMHAPQSILQRSLEAMTLDEASSMEAVVERPGDICVPGVYIYCAPRGVAWAMGMARGVQYI